jgi:uncharacterized protein
VGTTGVFLDTSCLIALARKRDSLHHAATTPMRSLANDGAPLVTSEWVLAEFLSGTAHPSLRPRGVSMVQQLRASPVVTVVPASSGDFTRTLAFYQSRADKEWSFVDCSSILICENAGITRVLTHDRHFAQAGFTILLGL